MGLASARTLSASTFLVMSASSDRTFRSFSATDTGSAARLLCCLWVLISRCFSDTPSRVRSCDKHGWMDEWMDTQATTSYLWIAPQGAWGPPSGTNWGRLLECWLLGWSVEFMSVDWLIVGSLVGCWVCWLVCWFVGLIGLFVGLLVCWFVGSSVGWFVI